MNGSHTTAEDALLESAASRDGTPASRPSVVHIITALGTGGAERQLHWLTATSRHPSRTIALYDGGPVGQSMIEAGQQVEILGMTGRQRLTAVFRLAHRLRRLRPDVVHVHLLSAQLWGIPAARLAGIRAVVSSEHSLMDTSIENRPLTSALRRLYRVLERLSTHTVAVSAITRQRLLDLGVADDRITVVDNGIDFRSLAFDPALRTALRAELGIDDTVTVVGAVGRLEPVKRFDVLVRSLAPTLASENRMVVIAGDGPLRTELLELAANLGVADRVRLLGPRRDMAAVLAGFDVLASPSQNETFGMAVIEALGNGLPVAYAQCPALAELPARPGWAARIDDSDETASLRSAVDAAMAAHGRQADGRFPVEESLTEAYGIDQTAAALDSLYEQFAARRIARR